MNTPAAESGERERAEQGFKQVGELTGDRCCTACGFNLVGQQIVREPVYGILMVRCPECATPAALQEYPSLGRWAGRLSFLAAAVFILGVFGAVTITCVMFSQIPLNLGRQGVREVADKIGVEHLKYQTQKASAASPPAGTPTVPAGIAPGQLNGWAYDQIEMAWWDSVDHEPFKNVSGAVWERLDRSVVAEFLGMIFLGTSVGMFWSVVLCAVRRRWIWLAAVVIAVVAGAMVLMLSVEGYPRFSRSMMAIQLAEQIVGFQSVWRVFAVLMASLLAGLYVGRSIARLLVRWLMMPRYQGLFAFLWHADGLRTPSRKPGKINTVR